MKNRVQIVNVDIATMYGVDIAMIFSFFVYWIARNLNNDKFDLTKGMYISVRRLNEYFTCFSEDKLYRILRKMVTLRLLKRAKNSKDKSNQTYWYCFDAAGWEILEKWYPKEFAKIQNGYGDITKCRNGDVAKSTSDEIAKCTIGNSTSCNNKINKKKINKKEINEILEINKDYSTNNLKLVSDIENLDGVNDSLMNANYKSVYEKVLNHLIENGGDYSNSDINSTSVKSKRLAVLANVFEDIQEYTKNEKLQYLLIDFFEMKLCDSPSFHQFRRNFARLDELSGGDESLKIQILEQSVCCNYKGIYAIRDTGSKGTSQSDELPF